MKYLIFRCVQGARAQAGAEGSLCGEASAALGWAQTVPTAPHPGTAEVGF